MSKKIKHEGELDLNGIKIPCYVLDDGTRVLSGRAMQNALKLVDESISSTHTPGNFLVSFIGSKKFNPFIISDKDPEKFKPITCYKGNQKINGYEATTLADICDGILEARKQGVEFSEKQTIIANQCEILIRSLAKVGIIALIDEATGYQYTREKDELQKILKAYISEELLPWQKKFPDVFYKELFRLNGWDFTVNGIKKRPGVIGNWTKTLIYEPLPKGVLEELEKNTPKSEAGNYTARFHQSLTPDLGNPHLTAQINQIITLFMLSDNMKDMWNKFEKLRIRQVGQLELPFQFDEQGHTKEPIYEKKELSSFNKDLKKH